jgi:hypothetical protein
VFWSAIQMLGETWKDLNEHSVDVMDSFPVAVCANYRIPRCRIPRRSFSRLPSQQETLFLRPQIHLLITQGGQPVEFFLTSASFSDTTSLRAFLLDLPDGAKLAGDKAYNDYTVEDVVTE